MHSASSGASRARNYCPAVGLLCVGLAVMPCGNAGAQISSQKLPTARTFDIASIDSIVQATRRDLRLPAVSMVIIRGGHILLSKGYGLADRESGLLATDSTIYPIGSLSKQITAAALLKLVEAGRVRLRDPLTRYFPELPLSRDTTLRVENLMRQTSGIESWDDYPELQGIEAGRDSTQFRLSRIIELIGARRPLYPPGSWWSYSNSNYTLLAGIIERVTGLTYDQYLARELLGPLGLRSTASCAYQPLQIGGRQRAVGYEVAGDSLKVRHMLAYVAPGMTGAGGLCSTARDIATWMRALVDGRVVHHESFRRMVSAKAVTAGFAPPYGFGISTRPLDSEPAIWHIGVMAGYTSVLAYFPRRDLIIGAIVNARRAPIQVLLRRIVREVTHSPAPVIRDLPLSAGEATSFAGTYDDAMFKFSIVNDSDTLIFHGPFGAGPKRMLYQGANEFAVRSLQDLRFTFKMENGRVKRLEWDWGEIRAYGKPVREQQAARDP